MAEEPGAAGARTAISEALTLRTSIYLLLMTVSAGMSLVRGFVVAGILDPADFTTYAVVVAVGTFLSNLLSFGLVEGTVKQFPRITASGSAAALLGLSDAATRRLALRAVLCLPLFAVAMHFVDPRRPMMFVALTAIAFGVAVLGLLASVQRSLLNVLNVALANGVRAILYLVLAALGGLSFGLEGAVAGEIVAALLGAIGSREIFKATLRRGGHPSQPALPPNEVANVKAERGVILFLAYSALAAPTYLDRAYVTAVFPASDSAAYALLALFAAGATVFVNIVGQKVGPEIIAQERAGAGLNTLVLKASRWSVAIVVIWVAVIACAAWIISTGMFGFLSKYALTRPMFIAIMLLGCVQTASLFEFVLIARDMERHMLSLTLLYLGAVCILAAVAAFTSVTLLSFIKLLALAKLAYLGLVLLVLYGSRSGTRSKLAEVGRVPGACRHE